MTRSNHLSSAGPASNYPDGTDTRYFDRDIWEVVCVACKTSVSSDDSGPGPDGHERCYACLDHQFGCPQCGLYDPDDTDEVRHEDRDTPALISMCSACQEEPPRLSEGTP